METIEVYPSAKYATLYEGKDYGAIKDNCEHKRTTNGRVVYRYANEVCEDESFDGKRFRPVKVTDTKTGDVSLYYEAIDVAKKFYVGKSTVINSINAPCLLQEKYKVEYYR